MSEARTCPSSPLFFTQFLDAHAGYCHPNEGSKGGDNNIYWQHVDQSFLWIIPSNSFRIVPFISLVFSINDTMDIDFEPTSHVCEVSSALNLLNILPDGKQTIAMDRRDE